MDKLKKYQVWELKMLKTALNTLIAYDLHQDILIKTEEDGGDTIRTYDNGYYFKVVR